MNELIFLVEEDIDGGYNAQCLGESIFTEGDSIIELKKNIHDALKCHYDDVNQIPKVIRLHYSKEEILTYG